MIFSNRKICIVGAGGFGREVLCCLIDIAGKNINIEDAACFMVGDEHYHSADVMGIPVIRQSEFSVELYDVVVAIGDPIDREKIVSSLPENTNYVTLIHPSVIISEWVSIGKGSIICAGCVLTCNIKIGEHAHLNLHTTIGHDCHMGDYFTTAPAANISGSCIFGKSVYFGTNASVRQGIKICDRVTIGMGGIVVKDILESGVYIGNPVRKI